MDFTNTKLAELNEDKRRLPRPKKRPVFNKGGHKHGERRKKSVTIFDSGKHKDNYEVYDERKDKWVSARNFKEDYDLDELIDSIDETKRIPRSISGRKKWRSKVANDAKESGRDTETVNKEHRKSLSDSLRNSKKAKGTRYEDGKWHTNNNRAIKRAQGHVESFQPLSASDALLILQEKKTYYSRCKCRGKCDCEAKMKARREAKKNQIKESALVLYGKYYNTNITEPTIAEQFKKRIDYCIANERDFDFLQSNIYVELFESLINERQQDYDAFISDVEPQEDDLYKEAFTDEHVNNIVDEMIRK